MSSTTTASTGPRKRSKLVHKNSQQNLTHPDDEPYFESYSSIFIHEEMLKDAVRTKTYRDAITPERVKDKVVVDVGCGTGILSVFCAQAGAAKVYAIDASDIAKEAEKIVSANNLSDVITVIQRRVEDIPTKQNEQQNNNNNNNNNNNTENNNDDDNNDHVFIPDQSVDVIVSEWMGYFLLYESMLDSVILARDKWLKKDGIMLPSHAAMYLAPISDDEFKEEKIDFWQDVYGIDMSSIIPYVKQSYAKEAVIEMGPPQSQMAFAKEIKSFDLKTVTVDMIKNISSSLEFSSFGSGILNGFVGYFSVFFSDRNDDDHNSIVLSTAPEAEPTHWQNTLFYLSNEIQVTQDTQIECRIVVERNSSHPRFIDITLEYSTNGEQSHKQTFLLR